MELIKEEVNVKKITFGKSLKLDTRITPELKEEGVVREIIRQIQGMRKEAKLKPKDRVFAWYSCSPSLDELLTKKRDFIAKEAKLKKLEKLKGEKRASGVKKELQIGEEKLRLGIKRL